MYSRDGGKGVFGGLLFLTAGVLLLLANFNLIALRSLLSEWWPALLIIIGVKQLVVRGRCAWLHATFWLGTGALFLGVTLGYLNATFGGLIWPVMLIWFGVIMAFGSQGGCREEPSNGAS